MQNKLNKKNDYAFKHIFGHEDHKDILARFLSVILDLTIEADELTLVKTDMSGDFLSDKDSILDIQVKRSKHHEKMNIEMQQVDTGNIAKRVLYYWARSFSGELKKGQKYEELPKQINILIADFNLFTWQDPLKFHGIFKIRDLVEEQIFCDSLEIHVLELPKLRKNQLKLDALKCWLLYLDNMEGEIMEQIVKQEPLIERAITIEEAFLLVEEERYNYELREKGRAIYENAISWSLKQGIKQGQQEGLQEGMQQGLQQGLQKGRKEGRQKGRQEGRQEGIQITKHELARKMLEINMRLEDIIKVTGLTPEEIKKL